MQTPSKTPALSAPPGSLISTSQMLARQDRLLHARPVLVASTTACGASRASVYRALAICPLAPNGQARSYSRSR